MIIYLLILNKIAGLQKINNKFFLYIHIKAILENNKVNKSIIKFIAQYLNINQSQIEIIIGAHTNFKVITINTQDISRIEEQLKLL